MNTKKELSLRRGRILDDPKDALGIGSGQVTEQVRNFSQDVRSGLKLLLHNIVGTQGYRRWMRLEMNDLCNLYVTCAKLMQCS